MWNYTITMLTCTLRYVSGRSIAWCRCYVQCIYLVMQSQKWHKISKLCTCKFYCEYSFVLNTVNPWPHFNTCLYFLLGDNNQISCFSLSKPFFSHSSRTFKNFGSHDSCSCASVKFKYIQGSNHVNCRSLMIFIVNTLVRKFKDIHCIQ